MRPIDADVLKSDIPKTRESAFEDCRECTLLDKEQVQLLIDKQPTLDAVPVKHGRWIDNKKSIIGEIIERNCSLCGQRTTGLYDHFFPYCPNCGAKMDEKEGT